MNAVAEFLLARIEEDESVARQAEVDLGRFDRENVANGGRYTGTQGAITLLAMRDGNAMDPARVLAECAARLRIVEMHSRDPLFGGSCSTCIDASGENARWPCPTLRALASVYADHPDCRQEWALL